MAAAFSSSARGTAAASFLELGVGGRAEGLGEAYSAVADDASALYWNPAALTRVAPQGGSAMVMHAPYVTSTYYDYAALAYNTGRYGAWGAGAQYFTAGSITQTDRTGAALGQFNPYDLAGSIGYAYAWHGFALGATGKFIQSKIIASAQTFAADAGILTPAFGGGHMRFAATVANLGGAMKFEADREQLPLTFRSGLAWQVTDHWLLSADGIAPRDDAPYAAAGTEYVWPISEAAALSGRLGYNSRTLNQVDGVSGATVGVGFAFRLLSIDYAFLPMGQLGLTHRISLSLKWGNAVAPLNARPVSNAPHTPTCEELYGAANCQGHSAGAPVPVPPPVSSPALPPQNRRW